MKIKTVKKLNLPELINHVWENEDYPNRFVNNFNGEVVFNDSGKFMTDNSFISHYSLFTVEVEEEITEDTEFGALWELYYDTIDKKPETWVHFQTSVSKILDENSKEIDNITLAIYYGSTLIWSKDLGIPESGVLEVDAE